MMREPSGGEDGLGVGHPDVDALIGYVRGELSQLQAGNIRAHAVTCVDCGDQLAALIVLREDSLSREREEEQATVKRFPGPVAVPATVPAPSSHRKIAVAVAASLVVLLGGWGWWMQAGGPRQPQAAGPQTQSAEGVRPLQPTAFERTPEDVRLVMGTAEFLTMVRSPATSSATSEGPTDEMLVALGLQALVARDMVEARRLLEPFEARWEPVGTAIVGSLMFLQADPDAYQVLEMYAADHEKRSWPADAGGPEATAFFFLARLRHVVGDEQGALEALGWIAPDEETGEAAATWRQRVFGEPHGIDSEAPVAR